MHLEILTNQLNIFVKAEKFNVSLSLFLYMYVFIYILSHLRVT